MKLSRRDWLKSAAAAAIGAALPSGLYAADEKTHLTIALGEYSFNSDYRAGRYDPLNLAAWTREKFGLGAVDYVSSFWADKAGDKNFLRELSRRASDHGIVNHIILVDLKGPQLGDLNTSRRKAAVEAHRPWLDVAAQLSCSAIRVNLDGFDFDGFGQPGNKQAVLESSVDGYGQMLEHGARSNLDVLVQNHLGYSCDPEWLVGVMRQVHSRHAGIEADPGHFQEVFYGPVTKTGESYERYAGWAEILPYSKALNAKTHAFDAAGNETTIDYRRILNIANRAGYNGYIGIEWEPEGSGRQMSPAQGIEATKNLLRRYGAAVA